MELPPVELNFKKMKPLAWFSKIGHGYMPGVEPTREQCVECDCREAEEE